MGATRGQNRSRAWRGPWAELALGLAMALVLPGAARAALGDVVNDEEASSSQGFGGILADGDNFGYDIDGIGDLDGDGFEDAVVGAWRTDDGGSDRGAVWILFLDATGRVLSQQKISDTAGGFTGVLDDVDRFGSGVAGIGDLDGDGVEDIAVGAYFDDDGGVNRGAVWILFLNTDGTVKGHQKLSDTAGNFTGVLQDSDTFGLSVANVGDVDGDGVTEIVVGEYLDDTAGANAGAVWVVFLNPDGTAKTVSKFTEGVFGFTGDLDANDTFGRDVTGIGDIDGNGVPDIAVSAPGDDDGGSGFGAVWITFLAADGLAIGQQKLSATSGGISGAIANAGFSLGLGRIGDLDADGIEDLAVGAWLDDDGGGNRGALWLLNLNANGTVKAEKKISALTGGFTGNTVAGDVFGFSIGALGDLGGDGISELGVGAYFDDGTGADRGAVYMLTLEGPATADPDLRVQTSGWAASHSFEYFPGDTVTLAGQFSVCDNVGAFAGVTDVDLVAVAWDPLTNAPLVPESTFKLQRFSGLAVNPGCFFPPAIPFNLPLSGVVDGTLTSDEWLVGLAEKGRHFRLRFEVDPDDLVVEGTNEANNQVTPLTDGFQFQLTGIAKYGAFDTTITALTLQEPGSLPCVVGERRVLAGSVDWNPSTGGMWTSQSLALVVQCATISPNLTGDALDLIPSAAIPIAVVDGTLDGLTIVVNGGTLDGSGFLPTGNVQVNLPTGHSIHATSATTGGPEELGPAAVLLSPSPVSLADLADLVASVVLGTIYLQAPALPFALLLDRLDLDPTGVSGTYNTVHYAYDLEWASKDNRGDVRIGPVTNDRRFQTPRDGIDQTDVSLRIAGGGLETQIDFKAGAGSGKFPRNRYAYPDFFVAIDSGKLVDGQILGASAESYFFRQGADCPGCVGSGGAPYGPDFVLDTSAQPAIGEDGAVLAPVLPIGRQARWGPRKLFYQILNISAFRRIDDHTRTGIHYMPGFIAKGTGGGSAVPVAEYLLGMRAALPNGPSLAPETAYRVSDDQSRRGNHFMAGLTVGPEIYSQDGNSQPLTGVGQNLDSTRTRILFPSPDNPVTPNTVDVVSNIGAKYNLRRAGVTGVFNTTTPPQPTVYGYDLMLRRFAYRLITNEMDPMTWIDGEVDLPNPAGFKTVFSSMEILCTGDLGGAIVDREPCDDDEDNNNNGIEDENCDETLQAWRTDLELLTMAFVPDNPPADQCTQDDRILEIGSIIDMHAFDERMGLVSQWAPDGMPEDSRITGKMGRTLDRPISPGSPDDDRGFAYAINEGAALRLTTNPNQGFIELTGKLGLPFWKMLPVRTRIENVNILFQDQTVLLDEASAMPNSVSSQAEEFMRADAEATNQPSARYQWGTTGWEIPSGALPLYYEKGRFNTMEPRFLGRMREYDAVVIGVNAGVDFVTTQRTKISFGASADFDALALANFPLTNVDVSDPDSVEEMDDVLDTFFNVRPVSQLLGSLTGAVDSMTQKLDAGMHEFIAGAVDGAVGGLTSEVGVASIALGDVHKLPQMVSAQIENALEDVAVQALAPLDSELQSFFQTAFDVSGLPTEIWNANNALLDPVALGAADDVLANIEGKLSDVQAGLNAAEIAVTNATTEFNDAITDAGTTLGVGITAVGSLKTAVTQLSQLTTCGPSNKIVQKVEEIRGTIEGVKDALDLVNFGGFGGTVQTITGVNLDGITSAANDVKSLVEELESRIPSAQAVENIVCGAGLGNVLAPATTLLDSVVANMNTLNSNLGALTTAFANEIDDVETVFSDANAVMGVLQDQVMRLRDGIDGALLAGATSFGDFEALASPGDVLNALNGDLADAMAAKGLTAAAYQSWNGGQLVNQLDQEISLTVDVIIQTAANAVLPSLNAVAGTLPHVSPEELTKQLVGNIMNSGDMDNVQAEVYKVTSELGQDANAASLVVYDLLNYALKLAIEAFEGAALAALENASGGLADFDLGAARMDGYAIIAGEELERLHVEAEFSMSGDTEDSSSTYNAALDVTSWNANGKGEACLEEGVDKSSLLDAIIETRNLPIEIGPADLLLKRLYLGFTLQSAVPVGIFGGVETEGVIDFQAFEVFDPQFHAGVGTIEVYLGVKAGARFDGIQMLVGFLVGRTCNADVLIALDPQVAEFIGELPNGFNGAYVRGSASFPIYKVGCLLTVGVGADAGGWVIVGPPLTIGGLVGGAIYGEAICLVSIRGQITAIGQVKGGDFSFQGEGFLVGGIGFCEPEEWSSISISRDDDWCGTGDLFFKATYKDGNWDVGSPDVSALH